MGDELCPYVAIQQYSSKYFVLLQIFSLLSHSKVDNQYIYDLFMDRVQKQMQRELELFLLKKCNLPQSEIDKIMISTDKFDEFNCSLSHFLYITKKTLDSMGIAA